MNHHPRRVISGGQTGADRAALDVARELGLAHGGWVPRGRWAEDGVLATHYQVQETESPHTAIRTEWNVRDADATLVFSHGPATGGTALTIELAGRLGKPLLQVDFAASDEAQATQQVTAWLQKVRPEVLNVAGPRASNDPLIYDSVSRVLRRVFAGPG